MSVAYLPSPARGVWQFGPVPVRAYALCALLGVVIALWLTDRRYRRMGGPPGMILDVATVAVPVGIIGGRLYSVLSNYRLYFGTGHDWTSVFRIWDGGLGVAGIVGAGAVGAWVYCRQYRYSLAPMVLAAAPALAVAQAIGSWGNWFSQRMYGAPSTLPFAVAIGPARRASGYESFATFQPIFLYESLWDLLVAVAVAWAIRRFRLTGDRAFALYAGLYAVGRLAAERARIDYSPRVLGIRVTEFAMLVVVIAATAYLGITRARRGEAAAVAVVGQNPTAALIPDADRNFAAGGKPVAGDKTVAGDNAGTGRSALRMPPVRHRPDDAGPHGNAPHGNAPDAAAPDGAMSGREGSDAPGLIHPA